MPRKKPKPQEIKPALYVDQDNLPAATITAGPSAATPASHVDPDAFPVALIQQTEPPSPAWDALIRELEDTRKKYGEDAAILAAVQLGKKYREKIEQPMRARAAKGFKTKARQASIDGLVKEAESRLPSQTKVEVVLEKCQHLLRNWEPDNPARPKEKEINRTAVNRARARLKKRADQK